MPRDAIAAVNPAKPRIFLADIEYAKKEEWERRRKLRLKQVRQQARDIASVIRNQAIRARKRNEIVTKCEQLNAEMISEEAKTKELENQLSECQTSVGTGHTSAAMLSEVDELVRHRSELQDTLARVRAELASEKNKETRKPRSEVVVNAREGISISRIASGEPAVRPSIKKYFPALTPSHGPPTPPNFFSKKPSDVCGSGDWASQAASEKTILSPPVEPSARSAVRRIEKRIEDSSRPDGRKSCPPSTEVEVDEGSSDSDSGQTWPPASVRMKKSSKVRMYDHSARKCTEYVQQCGIVRMETPEGADMKELIREEEDLLSKKTDAELENRRVELQRGVRALREEIAKQDWDSAIRDLCQFAKEKRIKKALTYPSGPVREEFPISKDSRDSRKGDEKDGDSKKDTSEPVNSQKDTVRAAADEQCSRNHRPPVKVPSCPLSSIIAKYNSQREELLGERSRSESESEEEDAQLPLWLQAEVEAQNATRETHGKVASRESHGRVYTPETVMESLNEKQQFNGNSSSSLSSAEPGSSPKASKKHLAVKSDSKDSQPNRETSESTSSGDINVEIRFSKDAPVPSRRRSSGDPKPGFSGDSKHQSSGDSKPQSPGGAEPLSPKSPMDKKSSPYKDSSSTSYYSPPDKLSPQQLSLLSDVLSRMSVKNRNPVLHHYINRVLEMSRQSVSDLDVSSVSEPSIKSELFKKEQSTPLRPALLRGRNMIEDVNSSTAVSVTSAPLLSSDDVSSSDNATEIAALLRNIVELQRLYVSATSSDPLSDSRSSYRSVPDKIGDDRCQDVAPAIGPVANFFEETGIFENPQKTDGQPKYYTIIDKDKPGIDIPCGLFPKPVFPAGDRQSSTNDDQRRFNDVPDGYAMRPEHHPISLQLPDRGIQKVIRSLSDIESEVSSIQSTPTKILGRRSTSPVSTAGSTVSAVSSSDFIRSSEMQRNELISSSESTSDFEDVFQSLGLGWALTTLRRIRNARNLPADDSSSKPTDDGSKATSNSALTSTSSGSKSSPPYRHSTPVKLKQCPKFVVESSENDAIPSLTPPDLTLLCPTLQK